MDEELERICMNCQSYYPDRLDEPTEFGICLNDSDFEPYLDSIGISYFPSPQSSPHRGEGRERG